MIVRPVATTDLPALLDLARCAGPGFTSLPANEERLAHRIRWAQRTLPGKSNVPTPITCSCSKTMTGRC